MGTDTAADGTNTMSSSTAPDFYEHAPLKDNRSIRVLRLEPASSYDSPLRCSIIQVNLDTMNRDDFKYLALSYAWGDKKGNREIICDGKILLVTQNCDTALRTLRANIAGHPLWVDAICIDQTMESKGLVERNHQIKIMGEIYKRAVFVLVWLGEGDAPVALVMVHIERIAKYERMSFNDGYAQRLYARLMIKRCTAKIKKLSAKQLDSEGTPALLQILRSSWILRVWTLQEVAFAQRCVVIFGYRSGFEMLSWDDLYEASGQLLPSVDVTTGTCLAVLIFKNLIRYQILSHKTKKSGASTNRGEVLRYFELLHLMQATESRDMVYGIYPILETLGVDLPDPDYSKPVESIYEEMTCSVMVATQSLQSFRFINPGIRKDGLPTWVPDWQEEVVLNYGPLSAVAAYGDSSPITFPGQGKLTVYGKTIGRVWIRTTDDFRRKDQVLLLQEPEYDDFDVHTLKEWLHLSESYTHNHGNNARTSLFLQTLLLGTAITKKEQMAWNVWRSIIQYPKNCEYDLGSAIQNTQKKESEQQKNAHWTQEMREALVVVTAMRDPQTAGQNGRSLPHAAALKKLHQRIYHGCRDRAFFITEDDRMGTCFHTVQSGDVLVLFKGTREPAMLRKSGDNYTLIGPAYVDGIMDPDAPLDNDISRMQQYTLI